MKTSVFNGKKIKKNVLLTICPTRSRLDKAKKMYKSFKETSAFSEVIFCVDKDDPMYAEYISFFGINIPYVVFEERVTTTKMYNEVAINLFPEQLFYSQTNDDFIYETNEWDTLLMERITSNGGWGISYGNDNIQNEKMCTTSVISGNIIRALGWLQLPTLTHLFGDNVWMTVGIGIDRLFYVDNVTIRHEHPADGNTEQDAIFMRTNSEQMYTVDQSAINAWAKGQHKKDVIKIIKKIHAESEYYFTVGLSMICGDYENPKRLEDCLMSVKGWVDMVNIVFNYKVLPNPFKLNKLLKTLDKVGVKYNHDYVKWTNFSDMRNVSFKMDISSNYIMWLDADDIVDNPWLIKDAPIRNPEVDCFKCRIFSYTERRGAERILHSRLLKNHSWLEWKNKVHEDLRYSFEGHDIKEKVTALNIHHVGNTSFEDVKKKNARNMKFTEQEMKSGNAHSLTYYAYVNELMIAGGYENNKKAVLVINEYFEKFPEKEFKDIKEVDQLVPKMWVLKGLCCMACNQMLAAKQALHKAWDDYRHPEAAPNLAECYMQEKNWNKALKILHDLYDIKEFVVSNIPFDLEEVNRLMLAKLGFCYDQKAMALLTTIKSGSIKNITLEGDDENSINYRLDNAHKSLRIWLESAEKYYSQYLSLKNTDLGVADRLCNILRNLNKFGNANAITVNMVNLYPSYAVGWRNLASFELYNKRYVTAMMFFKMALKGDPTNQEIRHNLKMIKNVLTSKVKRVK